MWEETSKTTYFRQQRGKQKQIVNCAEKKDISSKEIDICNTRTFEYESNSTSVVGKLKEHASF